MEKEVSETGVGAVASQGVGIIGKKKFSAKEFLLY